MRLNGGSSEQPVDARGQLRYWYRRRWTCGTRQMVDGDKEGPQQREPPDIASEVSGTEMVLTVDGRYKRDFWTGTTHGPRIGTGAIPSNERPPASGYLLTCVPPGPLRVSLQLCLNPGSGDDCWVTGREARKQLHIAWEQQEEEKRRLEDKKQNAVEKARKKEAARKRKQEEEEKRPRMAAIIPSDTQFAIQCMSELEKKSYEVCDVPYTSITIEVRGELEQKSARGVRDRTYKENYCDLPSVNDASALKAFDPQG
ncbi:hypothetical protein L227DRAFT_561424 [Lentinus tigrinus ALCF2SS1-6]|uniref:Uncharacterized protein n=1 Tax=Lentinus tigrinus ALCF2SS1-6 TaxID=1328759 RepID=A0A5C2SJL0_9APHY|nr:hypothetical protein L227DRAFT_561424 [Lentinus tigrinus ALCF2SS1-6]